MAARHPLPGALALGQLDAFLEQAAGRYPARWLGHLPAEWTVFSFFRGEKDRRDRLP